LPAECEVLGFGLEELVDEGFDAWLAPVPEGVFAPRGVLVCWAESIDEVKIDVGELESEGKGRAGFEAEADTREGRRTDEKVEAADESKGEAVGEFATIPKSALGVTESVEEVVSSGFFELPGVNEG
jgi:hypothetical protein